MGEAAVPVPARITTALDRRSLYGPAVDLACGVVEPAVDRWEAGTLIPTAAQVAALAELTGFPVGFFYDPTPLNVGPMWVCERSRRPGNRCHHYQPSPDVLVAVDAELGVDGPAQLALFDPGGGGGG